MFIFVVVELFFPIRGCEVLSPPVTLETYLQNFKCAQSFQLCHFAPINQPGRLLA